MPNLLHHNLGKNLRRARLAQGVTQRALAHAIGMKSSNSRSYISHLESGRVGTPRVETLCRIADALTLTLDELLVGKK